MWIRRVMTDNSWLRGWSKGEVLTAISYILLVVSGVFQARLSDGFAYMDEIATLLLCLVAAVQILKGQAFDRYSLRILAGLIVFILIGVTSSALSNVERSIISSLIDLFTCAKFFLMFLAADFILRKGSNRVVHACSIFARIYVVLMLVFLPLSLMFDLDMVIGERLGYAFLYGHPSNFAAAVATCLVVILAYGAHVKAYVVMVAILLISSDRSKAIAFAAIAVIAVCWYWNRKKIPVAFWMTSVAGSLLVAASQIKVYFLDTSTARSVLLTSAVKVANRFFPFGAGFATYGSNVTIADYSPLYYELGFEKVWGLTPVYNSYIADSFWPIIIGQFGYVGFASFLVLLVMLVGKVINCIKTGSARLWPATLIVIYLLIASTSESAFFSAYAPGLALALAMVLRVGTTEEGVSEKSESVMMGEHA